MHTFSFLHLKIKRMLTIINILSVYSALLSTILAIMIFLGKSKKNNHQEKNLQKSKQEDGEEMSFTIQQDHPILRGTTTQNVVAIDNHKTIATINGVGVVTLKYTELVGLSGNCPHGVPWRIRIKIENVDQEFAILSTTLQQQKLFRILNEIDKNQKEYSL